MASYGLMKVQKVGKGWAKGSDLDLESDDTPFVSLQAVYGSATLRVTPGGIAKGHCDLPAHGRASCLFPVSIGDNDIDVVYKELSEFFVIDQAQLPTESMR